MPAPKRHHFVPQLVLRRFADAAGNVWFHRKEFDRADVRRAATKNLFVQGQLNTIVEIDGTRNLQAEEISGRIETAASQLFAQIIEHVRAGGHPDLGPSAWDCWHHVFFLQFKRAPHYLEEMSDRIGIDQVLLATLEGLERDPPTDWPLLSEQMRDAEFLQQQRLNAMTAARAQTPTPQMKSFLAGHGMEIFRISPSAKRGFVLGDVGIARPESASPMFMPIAPDIALGLTGRPREVLVVNLSDKDVIRRMNLAMANQSNLIAASDRDLLLSVAKRRRLLD